MFNNNRRCQPRGRGGRQCRDSVYGCYASADQGPLPLALDVAQAARQNNYFRIAVWTGAHMQMTLMCIPICGEIGWEAHPYLDQFIRVESGRGRLLMGDQRHCFGFERMVGEGCAFFVPAGTWHNLLNCGRCPLKLSSIYAPPEHASGTVHRTREEAEQAEHGY